MNRIGESEYTSTARAAAALGVGVSTVKRWIDSGVLPAQKTAGGHRKVLIANVVELGRRGDLPLADLSQLAPPRRGKTAGEVDPRLGDRLYRALVKGAADQVRLLLVGAHRQGATIAALADSAVTPAMAAIGRDWQAGRIDVMEEHRASQICTSVLYEVKSFLTNRIEKRWPLAIGAAGENDDATLGTLLSQMCLIDCGWNAIDLGANTPFQSLIRALELKPRLMWLSAAHVADPGSFAASYDRFARSAELAGVPVVIGGRALATPFGDSLRCAMRGDSISQFAEFARTLNPLRSRPTRGRPRGS